MTYEHLGLRLPEIGRVKIGQRGEEIISKNGKKFQAPEKLDYFKICTLIRGDDNNLMVDLKAHEILGEKPQSLTVRPISGKLEENIKAGFAFYSKQGERLCHGDGQQAVDDKTGEIKPCPCSKYEDNYCKKYAKANFFLDKVGGVGGVHTMTIRGKITVPALVGSLKFLTEVCESGGGSIAGVPLELRLNELMTRYGKVYSPYFLFPGSTEDLILAAKKSAGLKFQVLGEDNPDDADDTEEEFNVSSSAKEDNRTESVGKAKVEVKNDTGSENAKPSDSVSNSEKNVSNSDSDNKKQVKAFWCDSCTRIVNDYATPAVCKCGETKFHAEENMKAAQEAIAKIRQKKIAEKTGKSSDANEEKMFFWCHECGFVMPDIKKPEKCGACQASHFGMEKTMELAMKAAAERPENNSENNEDVNPLAIVAERIKTIFGCSNQASIRKQISLFLDRKIESSTDITDEEAKDLLELTEALEEIKSKDDRSQFIENWKLTRKEAA